MLLNKTFSFFPWLLNISILTSEATGDLNSINAVLLNGFGYVLYSNCSTCDARSPSIAGCCFLLSCMLLPGIAREVPEHPVVFFTRFVTAVETHPLSRSVTTKVYKPGTLTDTTAPG